jgi:hypothetical protein
MFYSCDVIFSHKHRYSCSKDAVGREHHTYVTLRTLVTINLYNRMQPPKIKKYMTFLSIVLFLLRIQCLK